MVEISARPRPRMWHRLAVVFSALTILLTIGLLTPATLGLSQGLISDDAMDGSLARGALAFQSPVDQAGELVAGDVISFVAPGAGEDARPVTREILAIDGLEIRTAGRGGEDPWTVRVGEIDIQRVAFSVPYAGYPQLLTPALTWPIVTLLLGLAAAGATWRARRRIGRRRPTGGEPPLMIPGLGLPRQRVVTRR